MEQELRNRLGIAGEYRVLSELLLRGLDASITLGNAKGTDILIFLKKKNYLRIEVKTSKNGKNFITSYFPKYKSESETDPDFWVFFQPRKPLSKNDDDCFYVLSHKEVREFQLIVNRGIETVKGEGVDNIPIKLIEKEAADALNDWDKIKTLNI